MKTYRILAGGLCCLCFLTSASAAHAAPPASALVTHFPTTGLGNFLAEKFDLSSMRSSFGPRHAPAKRTFADFGITPTKAGDDSVSFETPGWFYQLTIVERRDINGDGIEDLQACFVDRALDGPAYHNAEAILITRYAADAYAVALRFNVDGACSKPPYKSGPTAR